ncbi:hypothetical protein JXA85_05625 [Candidatus Woesearchaeota archaeon]|nr:hypothetical protein [Candidatus Woesearchaeota archaeon]
MRKLFVFAAVFVLLASTALAAGPQGAGDQAAGQGPPESQEAGQGTGEEIQLTAETQTQEQNKGEEIQVQTETKAKVKSGEYAVGEGKKINVEEKENNRVQLRAGEVVAETSLEMTQEQEQNQTRMKVKLSNGKGAEIKIMPDTASERALERLRLKVCSAENGCTIELKEVGQGEEAKAAYEVNAEKKARVLGIFQTRMKVQAQVDAENGEVIKAKKPWWAFLATESEE